MINQVVSMAVLSLAVIAIATGVYVILFPNRHEFSIKKKYFHKGVKDDQRATPNSTSGFRQ